MRRLWLYQAERFPVIKTAVLVGVFSAASISVSAHLSGRALPGLWTFAGVWVVVIIIFFQMRACDEYKDLAEDTRYRPERPIPSGLVSLRLILGLAGAGGALALIVAGSIHHPLIGVLLLVWLWLGLMTFEFFVPEWLKARPALYLTSHMVIMPLITLFVTAAEWLPHGWQVPDGLWLFLALSFINGCVLEIGRKVWAPASEREGVETYSSLLGPRRAALLWAASCALAWALLIAVGSALGVPYLVGGGGLVVLLIIARAVAGFVRNPSVKGQKFIEKLSGVWVLICYGLAGLAPLIVAGAGS